MNTHFANDLLFSLDEEIQKLLPFVEKPARYIGGEEGSIRKNHSDKLLFALAFPEVYEVGASHFGGQIIYHIINSRADLVCERVFMPWNDMRQLMTEKKIPLFTLESKTPLNRFHIVGFTLENELSLTNVLEMMSLGGISLLASERADYEPIVIAGGVGAFHPEPVADFFDAFFVGDAEAGFVDVLEFIRKAKENRLSRKDIISKLPMFTGVYVPSKYKLSYKDGEFMGFIPIDNAPFPVRAAIAQKLENYFYPEHPIIPWIEIVHNRLRVELARGCGRGCRFCEAGYIYRPLRERAPDDVFRELQRDFELTGFDELGLLALSATDYTAISTLLDKIGQWTKQNRIKFSFPSLRIDSTNTAAMDIAGEARKSGLTFAPEAGTERLRAVINKPMDEEKFFLVLEDVFRHKWRKVKLYFMIGLPTETNEDIWGIIRMISKAAALAKSYKAQIRVTFSPFVPKPHTPFQWECQAGLSEIQEKIDMIISHCPHNVEISARDPKISVIEGILSRGDRRLSRVILRAWKNGAINAGWVDFFQPDIWFDAMRDENIDVDSLLGEKSPKGILPWDIVDKGINRDFLLSERERAYKGLLTPPCWTRDCAKCAFCNVPPQVLSSNGMSCAKPISSEPKYGRRLRKGKKPEIPILASVIRLKYSVHGIGKFIGHLDLIRIWERVLRKSNFPVEYTTGFHVRLKLSFAPPLPLGFESDAEYMDIFLSGELMQHHMDAIGQILPDFIHIREYKTFLRKPKPLQSVVAAAIWKCIVPISLEDMHKVMNWISSQDKIEYRRHNDKIVDIRRLILAWGLSEHQPQTGTEIDMLLRAGERGGGKPNEFFAKAGIDCEAIAASQIIRDELLIETESGWENPFGEQVVLPENLIYV